MLVAISPSSSTEKGRGTHKMLNAETARLNPNVHVPPWDYVDDRTANFASPFSVNCFSVNHNSNVAGENLNCSSSPIYALTELHRFLPLDDSLVSDSDLQSDDFDISVDAFSSDHFRMYEFKVRKCARGRSHDWTECPYAHPGEKARRRDPRKYHYSGISCPEFRKGLCSKGDSCEYAHGVFECWLHPARYRTQPCKDVTQCRRRVCFFAHTPEQLRVLPQSSPRIDDSYDFSPGRVAFESTNFNSSIGSSPTSTLYSPPFSPLSLSPPMSPCETIGMNSLSELASSMRSVLISKTGIIMSPAAWGPKVVTGFRSPRSTLTLRPGFPSLPSTPTRQVSGSGLGKWEEELLMERVESGKDVRARIYGRLSEELGGVEPESSCPDVGWVSELVK